MEKDFIQTLVKKYPNLFPKDENGNPKEPDCCSFCPSGWEGLVDDLCKSIDTYTTRTYTTKRKTDLHSRYKFFKYDFGTKLVRKLEKLLDPYKKFRPKDNKKSWMIASYVQKTVEQTRRYKLLQILNKMRQKYCGFPDAFYKVYPPPTTIAQIKEKYGELRFYYDGGNDKVDGMVAFAEFLSKKICQETGEKGRLCKRGGWYATLSLDKEKEHGYTPVNE